MPYSHAPPSTLEDQRKLIEDLARSNQEYTRKFTELNKAVEASNVKQEGVKDLSALENDIPPGIFQTNIAIPPSDSVSLANKTSEAHDNRHTIRLAIQGIPRDAGATSEELAHYCFLINHLLERIDAVQYKIRRDVRRRIRNDVMHMHQREADNLQELHGQLKFSMAMKTAKIWPQSPSPVEFRASQSSEGFAARTLLRKNVKSLQLKDGRSDGEGLVDDDG